MVELLGLPQETKLNICKYLPQKSLSVLALTCHELMTTVSMFDKTKKVLVELMKVAIINEWSLNRIKEISSYIPIPYYLDDDKNHCCVSDIRHRTTEAMRWIRPNYDTFIDLASGYGHFDAVKWFHVARPGEKCTEWALTYAAINGHYRIVEWLHNTTPTDCEPHTLDSVAASGHLCIIQFFYKYRTERCTEIGIAHAIRTNRLDVIQWLFIHGSAKFNITFGHEAALWNCLNILRFFYDFGCNLAIETVLNAAGMGFLDIVQWFHETVFKGVVRNIVDGKYFVSLMGYAARHGHLEVVKYLHHVGYLPFHSLKCAISNKHRHVVSWMVENEIGDPEGALNYAVQQGELKWAKWFHTCTKVRLDSASLIALFKLNEMKPRDYVETLRYLYNYYDFVKLFMHSNGEFSDTLNEILGPV